MKKMNKNLIIGLTILIIVVILVITFKMSGKKPFKNLTADDISSVSVRLIPPDKTIEITEIQKLVDILKDVVIYEIDDTEYAGQSVIYTIKMKDGRETVINACNPLIIINELGYKTKYEPCERLNEMANGLLEQN